MCIVWSSWSRKMSKLQPKLLSFSSSSNKFHLLCLYCIIKSIFLLKSFTFLYHCNLFCKCFISIVYYCKLVEWLLVFWSYLSNVKLYLVWLGFGNCFRAKLFKDFTNGTKTNWRHMCTDFIETYPYDNVHSTNITRASR